METKHKVVKTLEYIFESSRCFTQGEKYDIIELKNRAELDDKYYIVVDNDNDILYIPKHNFKTQ